MGTKRTEKVIVLYKSGNRVEVECDAFSLTKAGARLTGVEWDNADPKPLLFGVDDVEAVWTVNP